MTKTLWFFADGEWHQVGGGGVGITFTGPYPTTIGVHSSTSIVPSLAPTYNVTIVRLQAEPPVTGSTQVNILENGVSVYTITLASLDNEQVDTGTLLFSLAAGSAVTLEWVHIGTGGSRYLVHIEGG